MQNQGPQRSRACKEACKEVAAKVATLRNLLSGTNTANNVTCTHLEPVPHQSRYPGSDLTSYRGTRPHAAEDLVLQNVSPSVFF